MEKIILYLYYGVEEYNVRLHRYDNEGRLVEAREFDKVKSIMVEHGSIIISRQLAREPLTIVVDVEKPRVSFENNVLRIRGGGSV
ncbi:hypothetical protein ACSU1N_00770 [Thermogladius sp. 4427co]|uniref:hypothetical protein n=1 Tax=Thermogladius sp. 4427co TaxID=3450718 RepID=UPI003F7ABD0F